MACRDPAHSVPPQPLAWTLCFSWPESQLGSPQAAAACPHPLTSWGPGAGLSQQEPSPLRGQPYNQWSDSLQHPGHCCSDEEGWQLKQPHLVIDEQLDGVVAPLYQHDLIGLPGHCIREWGANAWQGTGPQPQADGEGVQFGQRLLDLAIQVVCAEGKGHFECIR